MILSQLQGVPPWAWAVWLELSVPTSPLQPGPGEGPTGCPSFRSDPSGEETFRVQVPDSITSWVGEAVGLSSAWGLGIATPSLLKTFKPFFVDFTLPPQVVRGEQVKIPLSIYNYMGTCAEVPSPPHSPSCCGGSTHDIRKRAGGVVPGGMLEGA